MFTNAPHPWRLFLLPLCLLLLGPANSFAQQDAAQPAPAFTVDGKVALASLMALGDGHLLKLADSLRILAATAEAQSADWRKIRTPLEQVGQLNVPALNWFALPDGVYWSVQEGKAVGNLATRAYFPKLLDGRTVIGDLVVSKATGKSVAIVAVPVMRPDKRVVGVLGASVYLDQLSARVEREMELNDTLIFYSFDAQPLVGLDWDPSLIFIDPTQLGRQDLDQAFRAMLAQKEGVSSYVFRGKPRTVLFRQSPVTGWWYALGLIPEGRGEKQPARP
jgi:hypothetical protein